MMKILLSLIIFFLYVPAPQANAQTNSQRDDNRQFEFRFGAEDDDDEGPKVINPFSDKYKPDLSAGKTEGTGLLPNFSYNFAMLRKPQASPDDLNLYISSPGTITGCLSKESASIQTVKIGPALQIRIKEGQTDIDRETVRYYHYECKPETGMVEMHLTLSKDRLIKDKITKLTLFSEAVGPFNDIMLDIHSDRIEVSSKLVDLSRFGIPAQTSSQTLTHWLYPENTMILYSSAVDLTHEKTRSNVLRLARRLGLTPLDELIPAFKKEIRHNDKMLVVDTSGRFKDRLTDQRDTFVLGKIRQSETYFGANGPYEKAIEQTIYARMPGIYE